MIAWRQDRNDLNSSVDSATDSSQCVALDELVLSTLIRLPRARRADDRRLYFTEAIAAGAVARAASSFQMSRVISRFPLPSARPPQVVAKVLESCR